MAPLSLRLGLNTAVGGLTVLYQTRGRVLRPVRGLQLETLRTSGVDDEGSLTPTTQSPYLGDLGPTQPRQE